MRSLYRRLPEDVRRCLRPLNLLDEAGSLLPGWGRATVSDATTMLRRLHSLGRVRYPVRRLEGTTRVGGSRLVCLLAADDASAGYWGRVFFAEPPAERVLGRVSAFQVPRVAARLAAEADVSLWQTWWPLSAVARLRPLVPQWVPLWLRTDRSLAAVIEGERSGRAARKNDVRRVERLGLTMRVVRDARSVEQFRERLVEPYGRRRFGDLYAPLPRHAYRHARRHGWLLVLERDGCPVAGALLEMWRGEPRSLAFGVDPDGAVPPTAALEACYYHAIVFAVERGFRRLCFGACRPVLTDGVVRYKRKWGAAVGTPVTWDALLLRYRHTPATRAAFAAAPLLVDRGRGRLAALVGAPADDSGDLAEHLGALDLPGIEEMGCLADALAGGNGVHARYSRLRLVRPGEVWLPGVTEPARAADAPAERPAWSPEL